MLRPINPSGPRIPGLSQAMLVESGKLLVLSGHVPFDSEGKVVPGGIAEQLDQVFANIGETLKAAGTDFNGLISLTYYVCDLDQSMLPDIRAVRDRWVNTEQPPASSLIGVAALFNPDVLIEVEAMAVIPESMSA
ncbi:RidA family protein [Phyllobacterium sp. 628]|uniref:RidA family protein n=1 Tax=Phyllobacterium sp. 628 TaxID=2718938 RepID=UPI0016627F65|nr:RidA family protein [Phyllobacterium sp. 628]QND52881.1 RidA family protein [Phyllobacterium sp. 628]